MTVSVSVRPSACGRHGITCCPSCTPALARTFLNVAMTMRATPGFRPLPKADVCDKCADPRSCNREGYCVLEREYYN